MSASLRDQLFKAGLVTQKPAEERKKQKGQRGPQGEPPPTRTPEEQESLDRQVAEVVAANRHRGRLWGDHRWYYIARDGRVPCLDLSDEVAEKLESGALALVESPEGTASFVDPEGAGRIHSLDPTWIRFFKN